MVCRLFGVKALYEAMLSYCQLDAKKQYSVKFQPTVEHYRSGKYVKNVVCETAAILFRLKCVINRRIDDYFWVTMCCVSHTICQTRGIALTIWIAMVWMAQGSTKLYSDIT